METKKTFSLLSPRTWLCALVDHRLYVSRDITNHIREYRCSRCGEEMTDTAQGFLARLTPKFRETNAFLAKIHQRRCERTVFSNAS